MNVAYLNQYLIGQVTDSLTGNSCWDSILIEDKLAPEIFCPIDTAIFTMEPPTPIRTGKATATDGCDTPTLSHSDDTMPFPNMMSDTQTIITRTWYAEDASGNIDSCQQLIYLVKPDLTMVNFPSDLDDIQSPACLLYTSPSPRDQRGSRMPSSA